MIRVASRNVPVAPCCLYTNGPWYVIPIYGRGGFVPVDPVVGSHENLRESITRCTMLETCSFVHYNGVCNNRIASIFTCMCTRACVRVRCVHTYAGLYLRAWKIVAHPSKRTFVSSYNFVTEEARKISITIIHVRNREDPRYSRRPSVVVSFREDPGRRDFIKIT